MNARYKAKEKLSLREATIYLRIRSCIGVIAELDADTKAIIPAARYFGSVVSVDEGYAHFFYRILHSNWTPAHCLRSSPNEVADMGYNNCIPAMIWYAV